MATYLQGVQQYIPQFQPFQLDLNLYANVLQTKQTQYDSAWKSLNNVYGQYFYADLTRDNNIERKDELIKNIDFNIKKIAGLDLSLDQNIGKAMKVFKPFYEDEYLMKDMAWTKNYNNQKSRAQGLKNSLDEEMREQYWDGGVRALDYMREEFKEVADQESLNFQNASYTPYVNTVKKAQEIAKEAGLSIEAPPEFSEDGRWIIRKKNGEVLLPTLSKLFEASLGSDPSIQAVYKTQAYLDRKDYAYSNAAQFGGDKNAAEMKYLEESYNVLKQDNEKRYKLLKNETESYDSKIKNIENQIKNKTAPPEAEQYLEQLKEAKDVNDKIIARIDKDNEAFKEESGTPATSTGFQNPYGDIKSLRWKVDNGMASRLMQKDLNEAANIFAYKDAKVDIDANPFAVNEQKHQFSMREIAARNAGIERAARIRNQGDMEKAAAEFQYASGAYEPDMNPTVINPETGEPMANPNYMKPKLKDEYAGQFVETNVEGSVADKTSLINTQRRKIKEATNDNAVPYLTNLMNKLSSLRKTNAISDEDLNYIFERFPGMTVQKMNGIIQGGKLSDFLLFNNDPWKAKDLAYRVQTTFNKFATDDRVVAANKELTASKNKFMDYVDFLGDQRTSLQKSTKEVETELYNQGFKYAKYLYDSNGRKRTEKEFYAMIPEAEKSKYAMITAKRGSKYAFRDEFGVSDYELGTGKPVTGGRTYGRELNYEEMEKAAHGIWTSGKIKTRVPGLPGGGTGLAQTERNSVNVATTGPEWLPGRQAMSGFIRDYRKIDFDNVNSKVTVEGASKSAFDGTDSYRGKRYKAVVDAFIADIASGKTKIKDFRLSSQNIAAGDARKGGMILYPTAEWLKQYKGELDDDGKLSNLLSEREFNEAIKNGFTVISNSEAFQNSLFKSASMSPLEAHIDYNTQLNPDFKYKKVSPYDSSGETYYTISKDKTGVGDYRIYNQYREYNPEKGEYEVVKYESAGYVGKNLEKERDELQRIFEMARDYNIQLKNSQ